MKHTLLALALAAASLPALAQTAAGAKTDTTSTSTSGAQAAAESAGGALTINSPLLVSNSPAETKAKVEYSGTQTIKNVPSVGGPPLTSSNDTCMGSASGSANGPGFGLSLGKTYVDDNCKMLKNSRELWNMGMKAAAMALMCSDPANREALELTGYECPQAKREREKQAAGQVEYTDPIVRHRLGLAPLK